MSEDQIIIIALIVLAVFLIPLANDIVEAIFGQPRHKR